MPYNGGTYNVTPENTGFFGPQSIVLRPRDAHLYLVFKQLMKHGDHMLEEVNKAFL